MRQLMFGRSRQGSWSVVTVNGEIDLSTSPTLHKCIAEEVAFGARSLVLDLSRLDFIDASGLRVFAAAQFLVAQRGGTLILTSPNCLVKRVLHLCRFEEVCPIYS